MPELKPFESSDDEIDPLAHKKLLENVNRLTKTQFIKKPTRTEPATKKNEFLLLKSRNNEVRRVKDATVTVPDLVKTLNKTKKLLTIGKELRNSQRKKKVLPKPLEKPVRDRIQRQLGYERAKTKLNRWDAVVTRNLATDHLSFPLDQADKDIDIIDDVQSNRPSVVIKSDLMKDMEVIFPNLLTSGSADGEKPPTENLTRQEMILRSKEMRAQRVRESQKSAKARFQNKIKSKKFHKIMKKQKIKEQIKEFELMQKTNPELALQKLEEFEKNRVLERALLRHKNTGTWAKNLQIRAKYDKSVRKDLSEQLALSRELTQKKPNDDDESGGDDDDEENTKEDGHQPENEFDAFNPWVRAALKNGSSIDETDFISGYRKYWEERNKNEGAMREHQKEEPDKLILTHQYSPQLKKKKSKLLVVNGWKVEECEPEKIVDNLDDLFDDAEETLNRKIAGKLGQIRNKLNADNMGMKKSAKKKMKRKKSNSQDLSFKKQAKRPIIDEELNESYKETVNQNNINNLKGVSAAKIGGDGKDSENINPDNFMNVKIHHLQTAMPEMEEEYDEDEDDHLAAQRRMTITEAFEDDDIVADFRQEKDDLKKKDSVNEIDLTLPGWGSWAGSGIKKKPKKLILKFPTEEKRRDENKGDVVIIENENKKLKEHLVSSLPFPFTNVKDFEASIRAPLSGEFISPASQRLLTKPAVITKVGAIIEPMNQDELLKMPKKPKSKTDKRIAKLKVEL